MPSKRNCGNYWQHDYKPNGQGRERCLRCLKLNPRGVPPWIRFWDYVKKSDGCWIWLGSEAIDGYGHWTINAKGDKHTLRAHRYAWFLEHGYLPNELDHTCDNRLCVRPEHLKPTTHQENINRIAVRRGTRGRVLTVEQVKEIRALRGIATQVELAKKYGVGPATIMRAQNEKTYIIDDKTGVLTA